MPYSTLLKFILFQSMGGGDNWALLPLSYASDSGAPKICQQGAKARAEGAKRQSGGDGVGGGGGGVSPSDGGEIFLKIRVFCP